MGSGKLTLRQSRQGVVTDFGRRISCIENILRRGEHVFEGHRTNKRLEAIFSTYYPCASCKRRLTGVVDHRSKGSSEALSSQLLGNAFANCDDACAGIGAEVYLLLQQRVPSVISLGPAESACLTSIAPFEKSVM